jgi:LuxR family transcriptional regulator, transcriptional regulator of spore coat protein
VLALNSGMRTDPDGTHSPSAAGLEVLSARQHACLDLAARGLTSAAIGARIGVSPRTVDEHLLAACAALGVRTRIQAVACLALESRFGSNPASSARKSPTAT